eukprot:TRINITY_DN92518_c0_g1_i1.p2 TRINITY_DN92518_c0_g1~~TRINITY_DN92518_c0_g1_i1.p2  ORF type:complete len:124 (+),score=25.73 TRINITY_DN92518_c0_g1_i1:65-436(+)
MELLTDLNGDETLCRFLADAVEKQAPGSSAVVGLRLEGAENNFASLSGILQMTLADGSTERVFLKKTSAAAMGQKAWCDKRRSLFYAQNELRFYDDFASERSSWSPYTPSYRSGEQIGRPGRY